MSRHPECTIRCLDIARQHSDPADDDELRASLRLLVVKVEIHRSVSSAMHIRGLVEAVLRIRHCVVHHKR